eukprot:765225-Hanusia_phi.AAC.2
MPSACNTHQNLLREEKKIPSDRLISIPLKKNIRGSRKGDHGGLTRRGCCCCCPIAMHDLLAHLALLLFSFMHSIFSLSLHACIKLSLAHPYSSRKLRYLDTDILVRRIA